MRPSHNHRTSKPTHAPRGRPDVSAGIHEQAEGGDPEPGEGDGGAASKDGRA